MLQVGVVGISDKTAPLQIREALARQIMAGVSLEEELNIPFVLVMTCNRFEIYFSAEDFSLTHHKIVKTIKNLTEGVHSSYFYSFSDLACFFHLSKVIAGLDAAILGESDVQRQIKKAYIRAAKEGPLDKALHYIFQKGLRIGKILRTKFFPLTSSKTLEELIALELADVERQKILFIGYSDMNRKIARFLMQKGFGPMTFCSRSMPFLPFEQRKEWIHYPIVIVATQYPGYLINRADIEGKAFQTKYLFDLGMPRNVDPTLSTVEGLTLKGLDEIVLSIDKKVPLLDIYRCEEEIKGLIHKYEAIYTKRELNKLHMFESVSILK